MLNAGTMIKWCRDLHARPSTFWSTEIWIPSDSYEARGKARAKARAKARTARMARLLVEAVPRQWCEQRNVSCTDLEAVDPLSERGIFSFCRTYKSKVQNFAHFVKWIYVN